MLKSDSSKDLQSLNAIPPSRSWDGYLPGRAAPPSLPQLTQSQPEQGTASGTAEDDMSDGEDHLVFRRDGVVDVGQGEKETTRDHTV